MKISEKNERIIEVEFDDTEMEVLHRIEEAFNMTPREVVLTAVENSIRNADSKIARYHDDVSFGDG